MKITSYFLISFILLICFSCQDNQPLKQYLSEIDKLMNSHPESAISKLDSLRSTMTKCSRSLLMQYEMLYAKAQNKAYIDFTSDSILLKVSDYYDNHGTANERMMAHYLLGCSYRDLGEYPRALECFKDAINCADTLSNDCDYRTMMSIYGQLSTLYDKQAMPIEEIEMNKATGKYALLCRDTISYIKSIELQVRAYNLLDDTAQVFRTTKKAYQLFMEKNLPDYAARTLPTAISKKLRYKKYTEAKELMDIYETQSGLFTSSGEITPKKSHYYNSKGLYYLGINQIDSADIFFRKLLENEYPLDAYYGLLQVYKFKNNSDSTSHYSTLYAEQVEITFSNLNMESVRKTEAMYDYSRIQKIAYEEKFKREEIFKQMIFIVFLLVLTVILSSFYFYKKKIAQEKDLMLLTDEFLVLSNQYQKNKQELIDSKNNFNEYKSSKSAEQEKLRERLKELQSKFDQLNSVEKKKALMTSSIVLVFKHLTIPKHKIILPTENQWEQLVNAIRQAVPLFYNTITFSNLTPSEFRVALLTFLDFRVNDIALLMNCSSQRISNAKRNANKKMFGREDSSSFKANLLHL